MSYVEDLRVTRYESRVTSYVLGRRPKCVPCYVSRLI